jgi:fluoroquinolone transport system permease protein
MKVWSNYCKEMKIASRGFYFYMEIIIAIILLAVLLLVVPIEPKFSVKEVIFMDMTETQYKNTLQKEIGQCCLERTEDLAIKLKPATIVYYDDITGKKTEKIYTDKKTITLEAYRYFDSETGKNTKMKYFVDNFDDMLRVTYAKKYIGSVMWYDDDGLDYYKTVLFGTETDRYKNLIASAHGKVNMELLIDKMSNQNVRFLETPRTLNNRQNMIPLAVVIMNGLMGMMVLIAYISIDKSEGLIKATAVSPTKTSQYLISKIMVVLTTSLVSTLVVAIPVMGTQPNYPLFILTALSLTILSCTIGLLTASYFKDIKASFGIIMLVMIVLMLPALTFLLPSFSPTWMKILPTYYMIEAIKETLLVTTDVSFVLLSNVGMVIGAIVLFLLANKRYKKILGI